MSRELPRQPRRAISAPGRGAHPLLRDPPDLRGRGQGAPDAAGLPLLPLAARPAHLPGDLGLHDLVAVDHQHAGRAARRRRALSPPAHHRGRLEHVGSGHLSEDRDNGPGARHDRRWILRSRLCAAITRAGDTRHLPRPDVERGDQAQGRAHDHGAPDAARVPRGCDALRGLDQPRPGDEGRARPLDRRAHEARVGPDAALARARLGDQEGVDRQLHGPPPALVARPEGLAADLQYHDIRPEKGVYYRLALNDQVDRITDDETIEQAKHVPPQTTRARLRGEFIRQANLKGKDYRVDWVYLKLNDPERETILCKDPFQSH